MTLGENSVALQDPEVEDAAPEEEEEEELEDIQDKLKDACRETKECIKAKEIYDSCATRVNSRSKTEETCHEEMMDYMHCVDHCVAKTLFSKLK